MRFPPSTRLYAPLLVLVFGLAVTWIEYELNLSNNLARNLKDVEAQADATGDRMTRRTVKQFQRGEPLLLAENIAGWAHEPWLKVAALVDENGVVIDDSEKRWIGRLARETTLSPAMKLADNIGKDPTHRQSRSPDGSMLFGAYAYTLEGRGTGWALLIYDRGDAVAQARLDANIQLRWAASGIALMCLCLWAALHFGFAARLSRLTQQVRDVGEGRATGVEAVTGGDEVRELSAAFAKMVVQLGQREAERVRLEREILETTERERRRIGRELHDGLGQQLTAASLATHGLISAVESAVPSLVPQVERLGQQLCECIAEVRALSHGLAPVALQEEGLMHALHELAEATVRNTGVKCVFECQQPMRVPDAALAGHLYRIAQEAVNNALKHAAPHEIRIGLEEREEKLVLEVDDDGEGLADSAIAGEGIGLRMMRHRALLVGGAFQISSPPAGGTRISCLVPSFQ